MTRKEEAVSLMKKVMSGESYLTYKEIASMTGYHEKYLLKLKKELESIKAASIRTIIKNIADKKFIKTINRKTITKLFYEVIKTKKINSVSKLIPLFPSEFLVGMYLSIVK